MLLRRLHVVAVLEVERRRLVPFEKDNKTEAINLLKGIYAGTTLRGNYDSHCERKMSMGDEHLSGSIDPNPDSRAFEIKNYQLNNKRSGREEIKLPRTNDKKCKEHFDKTKRNLSCGTGRRSKLKITNGGCGVSAKLMHSNE